MDIVLGTTSVRPRILGVLLAGALTMGIVGPEIVAAQTQESGGTELEEVTVTARKRSESVTETPISLSVLSAGQIDARGIRSLEDLAAFTPGFYFKSVGSFEGRTSSDLRFRGMDVNTSTPWLQLGSIFVDGVYISGGVQNIGFENIQRVEVIRGPQSALFGRSTFGGAVNFVTAEPDKTFTGRLGASFGEYGEREVQGWLSGPLGESLAGRISLRHMAKGGQYVNSTDGTRLGAQETTALSATLRADLTDRFTGKLVLFGARDDDALAPLFLVRANQANCGPFPPGSRRTFCGELPAQSGAVDADLRAYLAGTAFTDTGIRMSNSGLRRDAYRASLVLDYDFGAATLNSVSGYSDEALGTVRDGDVIPGFSFFQTWQGRDVRDFQQEIRLLSRDDGPLTWLVGANYYRYTYAADTIFGNARTLQRDRTRIETRGYFASASYRPIDSLELSLEGRYQIDEIDQGGSLRGRFNDFLPRAIVSYRPSERTTLYLTAAKGNKPGGFNANIATRPAAERTILASEFGMQIPIGEESIWNYELGWKRLFRGGRAFVNAAVYSMRWTDQQSRRSITDARIFGGVPFSAFINAGETELSGIELEAGMRVTETWEVSAAFAKARSEYTEFSSSLHQLVYGTLDASGRELANNPGETFSLSNGLKWPLSAGYDARLAFDVLYEGARWTDESNLTSYGQRWRVNARVGLGKGGFRASLYARNLFDDDTVPSARQFSDLQLGGFAWEVLMPEKRNVGIEVNYEF